MCNGSPCPESRGPISPEAVFRRQPRSTEAPDGRAGRGDERAPRYTYTDRRRHVRWNGRQHDRGPRDPGPAAPDPHKAGRQRRPDEKKRLSTSPDDPASARQNCARHRGASAPGRRPASTRMTAGEDAGVGAPAPKVGAGGDLDAGLRWAIRALASASRKSLCDVARPSALANQLPGAASECGFTPWTVIVAEVRPARRHRAARERHRSSVGRWRRRRRPLRPERRRSRTWAATPPAA